MDSGAGDECSVQHFTNRRLSQYILVYVEDCRAGWWRTTMYRTESVAVWMISDPGNVNPMWAWLISMTGRWQAQGGGRKVAGRWQECVEGLISQQVGSAACLAR